MKKRNNRRKKILLGILLFLLIIGNFSLGGKIFKPLSHFLKDLTAPIFKIHEFFPSNKQTYDRITSIKEKELRKEITELKKTLSLNQTLEEANFINATTIYRNLETWNHQIGIDKGAKEGIQKGMPAMTLEGLVGRVIDVSEHTSIIELLCTNKISKISVKIEVGDHYIYGLLDHYDEKKKVFQITGISENEEIPSGSIVTTTGMGEFYPAGLLVGTTSNVQKDHFDLSKIVEVETNVNFEDISIVTLLKRKDLEI